MPPTLPFHLVNAFAPVPHTGNQAAVVIFPPTSAPDRDRDPRTKDEEWMLKIAADFNFSETAYLVPLSGYQGEGEEGRWGLRWFTPTQEVALCGHATLASARTLFSLYPALQTISFDTVYSGTLTARRHGDETEITLPSLTPTELAGMGNGSDVPNETAAKALGLEARQVIDVSATQWSGVKSLIVYLSSDVKLGELKVNPGVLGKLAGAWSVTQIDDEASAGGEKLYINTRVFGPGLGIDEDPVTGSTHAYLTGYYLASPAKRFLPAQFQHNPLETVIEGRQLSKRGGAMRCVWDNGSARIVGRAQEFARGDLFS